MACEICVEVPLHTPSPKQFYISVSEDEPLDRDLILKQIMFFKLNMKELHLYDWKNAVILPEEDNA